MESFESPSNTTTKLIRNEFPKSAKQKNWKDFCMACVFAISSKKRFFLCTGTLLFALSILLITIFASNYKYLYSNGSYSDVKTGSKPGFMFANLMRKGESESFKMTMPSSFSKRCLSRGRDEPEEKDLLSGKFWTCLFEEKNMYKPSERLPHDPNTAGFVNGTRIVFLADQGMNEGSRRVLSLVSKFKPNMIIHSGDFDYKNNPKEWMKMIDEYIPRKTPYLASFGNHDVRKYRGYQKVLLKRLKEAGLENSCFGNYGIHFVCHFWGFLLVFNAAGTMGKKHLEFPMAISDSYWSGRDHLKSSNMDWRICSFHKNMKDYQVGKKPDETGYEIYDLCRRQFGALIATGHEHSYCRSKVMTSFSERRFVPSTFSNISSIVPQSEKFCESEADGLNTEFPKSMIEKVPLLELGPGRAVVFDSGLGGYEVKKAQKSARKNPWWGSIAALDDGVVDGGALFCTFYTLEKGYCEFRDTVGQVFDQFIVKQ